MSKFACVICMESLLYLFDKNQSAVLLITKAVNFSRRSRQSQISRNSAPAAKSYIMPRIAAIFANLGFWSHQCDDGSDTTRFQQPAAKFFRACRAFDVAKLNILNVTHEFICENIPWFEDDIQAKTELHTYLSSAGDLRATPHSADFWFAAAQ